MFFCNNDELKEVNGYSARLIIKEEYESISNTYSWRYNSKYSYWTMTPSGSTINARYINRVGYCLNVAIYSRDDTVVRPVINVKKSVLETNNNE